MKQTIDYQKAAKDLKDNPFFLNGVYWGNKIGTMIHTSIYESLDHAIGAKKVLAEQLISQLGYTLDHKDLAELAGTIYELERIKSSQDEEE